MAKRPERNVVITDATMPRPVYHLGGVWSAHLWQQHKAQTSCGVVYDGIGGAWLRESYATTFARPCGRCFR